MGRNLSSSMWMRCWSRLSKTMEAMTAKTMEATTANEKTAILGTAEKTLLKQAKKGFRQEAMKVYIDFVHMQLGAQTSNYL